MITKQLKDYEISEIDSIMRKNGYDIIDDSWMFNLYSPSLDKSKVNLSEEFLLSEFFYAIKWVDFLELQKLPLDILYKITNFVSENKMEEPYEGNLEFLISNILTLQSVDENYFIEYFKYINNRNTQYINTKLNAWVLPENMSNRLKVFLKVNNIVTQHKEEQVRV